MEEINYRDFIEAVKQKLSLMNEKEKTDWIHNTARISKEYEREKLLNSLDGNKVYKPLIYNKKKIEEWCESIEEGDISFDCSRNYNYADYWDDDYELNYYDMSGIRIQYYELVQLAENLLNNNQYKEASSLYDRLLNLSFSANESDGGDWYEYEFFEAVEEGLINIDLKPNFLYVLFQTTDGKERLERLYKWLLLKSNKDIRIDDILSVGPEELKDIDS